VIPDHPQQLAEQSWDLNRELLCSVYLRDSLSDRGLLVESDVVAHQHIHVESVGDACEQESERTRTETGGDTTRNEDKLGQSKRAVYRSKGYGVKWMQNPWHA
jgi:hypothetical protein